MLALALLATADAAPVKIAAATAKSSYSNGGVNYPADAVKDGKSATPWFEGDPGNGVGAWIEVDLGGTQNVTKLAVLAGDWSSGSSWGKANRPKEVQIQWSDGSTDTWTLADEWRPQVFTPSSPKSTSTIRLKFNQLFSGSAFPDTAISEILVWNDQPDPNATVRNVLASSEFPSDADGSYFAAQAADGVRDTFWCEGNKTSDGTGEWLEFQFDAPTRITAVSICNGMCSTVEMLKKTNAPARLALTFSDGSTQSIDVKGAMPLAQTVPLSPVTTSSVKMRVESVRAGTEFADACISEVGFKK